MCDSRFQETPERSSSYPIIKRLSLTCVIVYRVRCPRRRCRGMVHSGESHSELLEACKQVSLASVRGYWQLTRPHVDHARVTHVSDLSNKGEVRRTFLAVKSLWMI